MEQKKTLWITLAAGIFLLVVLLAAVALYAPQARRNENSTIWVSPSSPSITSNSYASPADTYSVQEEDVNLFAQGTAPSYEYSENDQIPSDSAETTDVLPEEGETSPANAPSDVINADNVTVYTQGTTSVYGTTIDLNESIASSTVTPKNEAAKAAIDARDSQIQEQQSASKNTAADSESSQSVSETKKSAAVKTTAPDTTASESTSKSTAKTTAKTNSKSTAKNSSSKTASKTASKSGSSSNTAAKSTKTTTVSDNFWVQVASYSSKKNADEARAILEENKLPGEVFTFTDASGKLYYRVRVGPYTTESEAKYWQSKIIAIAEFQKAGTYITNSSAPAK